MSRRSGLSRWIARSVLLSWCTLGAPYHPVFAQDEDPVVATVNEHSIRLSDVFASIESFPLEDQINMRTRLDLTVQSLVNEELLFQFVLSSDSTWERQLRSEIKGLVAEWVIQKHVKESISVDDTAIREYYQENRDTLRGWHVRVRHIRLRAKAACEAMMAKIDSEETFAKLAQAHSLDGLSAAKGGDLGYMMYSENIPKSLGFESEFFKMALHEMRIFESEKGCHLVRVVEIDDPPDPPFETIREFLAPKLERQQEQALLRALLEKASRDARVDMDSAAFK